MIDGILTPREIMGVVLGILAFDAALGAYLALTVSPWIAVLALVGAASMALYAGYPVDAKRLGLGELLVGVVWGPVIIGGTLLAILHSHPTAALAAYLPYAAGVSLVLIGKHMDKYHHDSAKGVRTLPVRLGLRRSGILGAAIALAAPLAAALGIYLYTGSLWSLVALIALATGLAAARILVSPKPGEPPRGWGVWPLWYVAAAYAALDSLGRAMVAALLAAGLAPRSALAAAVAVLFALWEAGASRLMHEAARASSGER